MFVHFAQLEGLGHCPVAGTGQRHALLLAFLQQQTGCAQEKPLLQFLAIGGESRVVALVGYQLIGALQRHELNDSPYRSLDVHGLRDVHLIEARHSLAG